MGFNGGLTLQDAGILIDQVLHEFAAVATLLRLALAHAEQAGYSQCGSRLTGSGPIGIQEVHEGFRKGYRRVMQRHPLALHKLMECLVQSNLCSAQYGGPLVPFFGFKRPRNQALVAQSRAGLRRWAFARKGAVTPLAGPNAGHMRSACMYARWNRQARRAICRTRWMQSPAP